MFKKNFQGCNYIEKHFESSQRLNAFTKTHYCEDDELEKLSAKIFSVSKKLSTIATVLQIVNVTPNHNSIKMHRIEYLTNSKKKKITCGEPKILHTHTGISVLLWFIIF